MRFWIGLFVSLVAFSQQPGNKAIGIKAAAERFLPGVQWRLGSVVAADFTCSGRTESAILGTRPGDILIAEFVNGEDRKPEVLTYSAKVRDTKTLALEVEGLDFDSSELPGPPPGWRRSKRCKGLNLSDGHKDSAHIYWNYRAQRFVDWSL